MNNFHSILSGWKGTVSRNAVWDNVTAVWKFDESSGNPVDSKSSISLTNTGGSFESGKQDNAVNISTSDKLITSDNIFNHSITTPVSWAFWYKPDDTSIKNRGLFSRETTTPRKGYEAGIFGGKLYYALFNNPYTNWIYVGTNDNVCAAVQWYHICITYSGNRNASGIKIYVDGVSKAFTTHANNGTTYDITCTTDLHIGSYFYNGSLISGMGNFDEYGVWIGTELSSTQVSTLYNSGSGIFY